MADCRLPLGCDIVIIHFTVVYRVWALNRYRRSDTYKGSSPLTSADAISRSLLHHWISSTKIQRPTPNLLSYPTANRSPSSIHSIQRWSLLPLSQAACAKTCDKEVFPCPVRHVSSPKWNRWPLYVYHSPPKSGAINSAYHFRPISPTKRYLLSVHLIQRLMCNPWPTHASAIQSLCLWPVSYTRRVEQSVTNCDMWQRPKDGPDGGINHFSGLLKPERTEKGGISHGRIISLLYHKTVPVLNLKDNRGPKDPFYHIIKGREITARRQRPRRNHGDRQHNPTNKQNDCGAFMAW